MGMTDFESIGTKIREYNLGRAKKNIASFNQDSAHISIEYFVEKRAEIFGNGDPDFRNALIGDESSKNQFRRLVKQMLESGTIGADQLRNDIQHLVSNGYLSKDDKSLRDFYR